MKSRLDLRVIVLMLACFAFEVQAYAGSPLSRWSWRHPDPQGLDLRSVAHGYGFYVAVGDSGTIVTSETGAHWTMRSAFQFPTLRSVCFGLGGTFVAVGDGGTIVTSTNGLDWTSQVSGTDLGLFAVAYRYPIDIDPLFVAVGENGVNLTSADGITWQVRSNFTTQTLRAAAAANGEFVVAGDNNTIFNGDGENWSETFAPLGLGNYHYYGATYGNGLWVLDGFLYFTYIQTNFIVYTPQGGLYWYIAETGGWSNYFGGFLGTGLAFGRSKFVAVGSSMALYEYAPAPIITSNNGHDWNLAYLSENVPYGVFYSGYNGFVAVGEYGTILTSSTGLSWSQVVTDNMSDIQAFRSQAMVLSYF